MLQQTRELKNIVLCFDGTGDWAGDDTTNVVKIYDRLDRQSQCTFYTGGVGTLGSPVALSPPRRAFLKLLDLATATSLRNKVLEAYKFLIRNYRDGDSIYLFGFRGGFHRSGSRRHDPQLWTSRLAAHRYAGLALSKIPIFRNF